MRLFYRFHINNETPANVRRKINNFAFGKERELGLEKRIIGTGIEVEIPQFDTHSYQLYRQLLKASGPQVDQSVVVYNDLPDNLRIGETLQIATDTKGAVFESSRIDLIPEIVIVSLTINNPVLFATDKYQVEIGIYDISIHNHVLRFAPRTKLFTYSNNTEPSLQNSELAQFARVLRVAIIKYEQRMRRT